MFSSTETLEAITGESSKAGIGGGATVVGIWRGLFADVGISQQELDGQRVFVDDGTIYPLGIPVTIRMRPVDVAGLDDVSSAPAPAVPSSSAGDH